MKAYQRFALTLGALLMLASSRSAAAQTTVSPTPVASDVRLILSAALFAGLPRRTVTVVEEKGERVTYSGVDLGAFLARNAAPEGHALHGSAAADYVLVRAADGYRTLFASPELDAAVTDKIVLLADQRNGAPLGPDLGPFRIVVPDEKRHLRWIHSVVEVDVIAAP